MSTTSEHADAGQAPSKSVAISALVQQLRGGQISRTELFDRLTRLHRGEAVPDIPAEAGLPPQGAEDQYAPTHGLSQPCVRPAACLTRFSIDE